MKTYNLDHYNDFTDNVFNDLLFYKIMYFKQYNKKFMIRIDWFDESWHIYIYKNKKDLLFKGTFGNLNLAILRALLFWFKDNIAIYLTNKPHIL